MSARYTVRPAAFADVAAVVLLLREDPDLKARSAAGWAWLFRDNPAHRRQDPPPEMGWVLECEGTVHGYLGNIHLDYVLDGAPLRAATLSSCYVRPAARAESTRLMSAFFRQSGVDLFVSTTACAPDAALYRMFKADAPRDASFSEGLVWVAEDRFALEDLVTRAGVPRSVARAIAAAGAPVSRLARSISGFATAPRADSRGTVLTLGPHEIDARFDRLGHRIAAAPGLRVRRDAAMLRWYLSDPDAGGVPVLFALMDANGVVAYAAAAPHRPSGTAMGQLRILDIVTCPGEESAARELFHSMLAYARKIGLGLLYCPPCGALLAAQLKTLRPYSRRRGYASHLLRATGRIETARLTAPGVWHATGLDGDMPFGIEYRTP